MARIIGGIGTTHVPSIGKAIAGSMQNDPYWSPFFRGFDYVHEWLAREKPDVAVVFSNDHGLNFFLDKLPTFAVAPRASIAMRTKVGAFRFRSRRPAMLTCPGT